MTTQDWRFEVKLISHQALAQFMKHRGFTVRSLAARTGVNKSTIGHLRSGARRTCRDESARAIAKALDCPVDALFVAAVLHVSRDVRRAS